MSVARWQNLNESDAVDDIVFNKQVFFTDASDQEFNFDFFWPLT